MNEVEESKKINSPLQTSMDIRIALRDFPWMQRLPELQDHLSYCVKHLKHCKEEITINPCTSIIEFLVPIGFNKTFLTDGNSFG